MPAPSRRPTWIPGGPFARLGRWTARHRVMVVTLWLALAAALTPFAANLQDHLSPGGFEIAGSTSDNARLVVEREFAATYPTSVTFVVSSDTLGPGDQEFDQVVQLVARAAKRKRALVGATVTPAQDPTLAYPRSRLALVQVGLTKNLDESLLHIDEVLAAASAQATPRVRVEATSGPAIFHDFNRINEEDLAASEGVQVPFILLALLVFFGSLVAAGVPVVATVVALACTLGGLAFLARVVDMSIYVQNVVPLIGIGVGVDYSLFIASRFRDEVREGRPWEDAAAVTVATAGKAIFFSGLTVAVALGGMFVVGVPLFTGFAIGTISVVMLAVAVGLTFTPALLVILGRRLFRINLGEYVRRLFLRPRRLPVEDVVGSGFWVRWAQAVMRRPWPVLLAATGILLLLAAPVLHMRAGSSGLTALPVDAPSRVALDRFVAAAGPGAASPLEVVVSGSPRALRGDPALAELRRRIADDPGTAAVLPRITYSRSGRAAIVTVLPRYGDDSFEGSEYARRLRDTMAADVPGLFGMRVDVGGAASQNADFTDTVSGNLPKVIALVMVLTFLVLVLLFRSILLPLKAVLMTLLSVLSSYGVLVLVFQDGWLDGPLGFTHLGHVTDWVPAFLFSILFGLSMDYEVFLLSRVREHRDRGAGDVEAVAAGLARTGRIITAAATIMIIVFVSFLSNRLIPLKELSLGLAVAVFLDATLVRLALVPAFMRLAGRWNWWLPGPLERVLPRLEE